MAPIILKLQVPGPRHYSPPTPFYNPPPPLPPPAAAPPTPPSSTSSTPPPTAPASLVVQLPVSQQGGLQIQQILSQPPQSGPVQNSVPQPAVSQPVTPPDASQPAVSQSNIVNPSRKRVASESDASQPDSKKAKLPAVDVDNQQRASEDANLPEDPQGKPDSFGQPKVWAEKRQPLCETLHHYRAHEAGVYQNDRIAYGLYIDAGVSPKDFFNDDIIITTLGGGKAKNKNGDVQRVRDHAIEGRNDTAFRNSLEKCQTILVIVGKKNTNCPVKLNHNFNVLGHFHITAMWYDKSETCCWMVKLQRVDTTTQPWYSVKGSIHISLPLSVAPSQVCGSCLKSTERIYQEEWICMTPRCKSYFKRDGVAIDARDYHYNQAFLNARSQFKGQVPVAIGPYLPDTTAGTPVTDAVLNNFKQGFVCSVCGCCGRQKHWKHWACENERCDATFPMRQQAMTIDEAKEEPEGRMKRQNDFTKPDILVFQYTAGAYEVTKYSFPDEKGSIIGFVAVYKSNSSVNLQTHGPDELFSEFSTMEEGEFHLERKSARASGSIVEKLTQQFSRNYGSTYKFIVRTESQSFSTAPEAILRVLKRCTWASEQAVKDNGGLYEVPNELLALGYTQSGEMGWHDDGEKTVGQTVASLSLGGRSTMHFRPKAKTTLFGPYKARGVKSPVLQFTLEHGDMMVMHGSKIQELYEHCVYSYGKRRYALTCRTMIFDNMVTEEEKQHAMEAGAIPDHAEQFNYDGDAALAKGHTLGPLPKTKPTRKTGKAVKA
ncbi:hypothetical protein BKA64DRAFT_747262 [Cadophora sp. MPI-SDFR-AT-0126]|nr:hypothetical protein BKA64DRAFT_747262 [Leotiomycetes sp. MPI-SDFR-AT-0126]